mmetsp:Transcript_31531/g.49385  ORF Transcript_31531/g.49385 Transcript_31531/m.49385 type:complete len:192 (+) Transcript_31531:159-734(+)
MEDQQPHQTGLGGLLMDPEVESEEEDVTLEWASRIGTPQQQQPEQQPQQQLEQQQQEEQRLQQEQPEQMAGQQLDLQHQQQQLGWIGTPWRRMSSASGAGSSASRVSEMEERMLEKHRMLETMVLNLEAQMTSMMRAQREWFESGAKSHRIGEPQSIRLTAKSNQWSSGFVCKITVLYTNIVDKYPILVQI